MLRKCVCFLVTVGVVFLTAGEGLGAEQTGILQVIPVLDGAAVPGGTVSVCRVGAEAEAGIQVTDGLANWTLEESEVLSEDWLQWVLENAGDEKSQAVEADGAVFTQLQEGVYLVRQTDVNVCFTGFQPFLVTVAGKEGERITRKPQVVGMTEVPRTGDHPAPIIGAMGIGFSVAVLMVLVDGRKK